MNRASGMAEVGCVQAPRQRRMIDGRVITSRA
jgi:hypothetical protein